MSDAQTLAHMFIGFNGPSLQQLKKDIENGSKEFNNDVTHHEMPGRL